MGRGGFGDDPHGRTNFAAAGFISVMPAPAEHPSSHEHKHCDNDPDIDPNLALAGLVAGAYVGTMAVTSPFWLPAC